ncbi:MAG: SsrA-binding protein SmpB [Methanobrevibacter sp.]|nr:SsrA-binding protein SmpB [Methanobrevibacter sp.]
MMKTSNISIKNRKASHEYFFLDTYIAGIQLIGVEIKSVRNGEVNLSEAYCIFQNGELYLKNTHISPYENAGFVKVDPLRDRKLLLNKNELRKLSEGISRKGLTIVPTKMFVNERGLCKVEICLCQGKKNYDKRESLKEKDMKKRVNNLDY